MPRIVVFGPSGSGKSTLSTKLSSLLEIPCVELDALHWEPGFISSPAFLSRVQKAVEETPSWIVDGNYKETRRLTEAQMTHAVWLNFPLYIVLYRILKRTFWRWWSQELLWGKCRESLSSIFSIQEGLIYAVVKNFRRRIREHEARVEQLRSRGVHVWIFTSTRQVNKFVTLAENNKDLFGDSRNIHAPIS